MSGAAAELTWSHVVENEVDLNDAVAVNPIRVREVSTATPARCAPRASPSRTVCAHNAHSGETLSSLSDFSLYFLIFFLYTKSAV